MTLANFASLLPTDASALETSISALESSISALESSISALESSIAPIVSTLPFWEYFGFGSAFVVVVGVLLELLDVWHRHGEDKTAWALSFFGVSRSLEKPRFINKYWVELVSVILVAGGVAGEVGAGLMIESKNTALRAIDVKLRSANSELRSKSDRLRVVLNKQVEDERMARVHLEKSLQPHSLSNDQKASICRALGPKNALNVVVEFPTADMQEAYAYAEDFAGAINACVKNLRNWTMGALPVFGEGPAEPIKRGLWLKCDSGVPETKRLASLLERTLKAAEIPVDGIVPTGTAKPGAVTILVGFKPQPTSETNKNTNTQ